MTVKYVHEAPDDILILCADSVVGEVFEQLQQGRTEPQEHVFYHVPEIEDSLNLIANMYRTVF